MANSGVSSWFSPFQAPRKWKVKCVLFHSNSTEPNYGVAESARFWSKTPKCSMSNSICFVTFRAVRKLHRTPLFATKIPAKGVIEATKVAWKAWGNVGQDLHKKLQKMFFSFLRLSSCWGRCRYCCNCCSGRCRRVAPPFFCCSTSDVMATWRGAEKAAPRSTHRFDFSSNFECLGYDGKEIEKRQLRVATLSWC